MDTADIQAQIKEHMEVVGSDSKHVGIVDHLNGDNIKLTHHDSQAGGKHHFLPQSAIMSIGEYVTLNMTAAEAETQWAAE